MKKNILFFYFLTFSITIWAQNNNCNLKLLNNSKNVHLIDAEEAICISKKSDQKYSLFYTFGIWCEPCIKDLPDVLHFVAEEKIPLNVIIKDKEKDPLTFKAIKYLKLTEDKWQNVYGKNFKINILILKDSNGRPNRKYKKFLTKITPEKFEIIDSMSKLILINNKGEVLMVTSYKDNKGKGKSEMIHNLIKPLIIK
ncbi:MAG TPA: hypothetical protein VK021_13665 [Flavobacteriaceae bacterium]|nr:hypothetical protein [Flavobacteriaceae bacterium]